MGFVEDMKKKAIGYCEAMPDATGLVSLLGCSKVVYLLYLYGLHEAQRCGQRFAEVYDKDRDGKIDVDTELGRTLARWPVRLAIWAAVLLFPLFWQEDLRDGTALREYVSLLATSSDVVVTVFSTILKIPRRMVLTLQATSFALKSTLDTVAAKKPLASWIAIFAATAKPMGLIAPQLTATITSLAAHPVRTTAQLLARLGRAFLHRKEEPQEHAREENPAPAPPPSTIPPIASVAILVAWIVIGVLLDADIKTRVETVPEEVVNATVQEAFQDIVDRATEVVH